jgi:hypothetical protein
LCVGLHVHFFVVCLSLYLTKAKAFLYVSQEAIALRKRKIVPGIHLMPKKLPLLFCEGGSNIWMGREIRARSLLAFARYTSGITENQHLAIRNVRNIADNRESVLWRTGMHVHAYAINPSVMDSHGDLITIVSNTNLVPCQSFRNQLVEFGQDHKVQVRLRTLIPAANAAECNNAATGVDHGAFRRKPFRQLPLLRHDHFQTPF